jgi:hypothetical protein
VRWFKVRLVATKARLANKQGQYAEAMALSDEHLHLCQESGQPDGDFELWLEMGHTSLALRDFDRALECFARARDHALKVAAALPHAGVAFVNRCLGFVELGRGNITGAMQYSQASLQEVIRGPFYEFIPSCVALAAEVAAGLGQLQRAARLSAASRALYASTGRTPWEDGKLDTLLPDWRGLPDQSVILQAISEGEMMSMEQAAAYAMSDKDS